MNPFSRRSLLGRAGAALAAGLLWPVRRLLADDAGSEFVVHEWGVFVCGAGKVSGEGVDVASRLPDFVYSRRGDHRRFMAAYQTALDTPAEVWKPVVHFYGRPQTKVTFRTRFAEGRPLVWWPTAAWDETSLAWELELEATPTQAAAAVGSDHWFARLREPEAMYCRVGDRSERFLYYDGETRYVNPLVVRRGGEGGWSVENAGTESAEDVYLCGKGGEFVSFCEQIAPGETWTPAEPLGADPVRHLTGRLVAAGLYEAEAKVVAGIWEEEFFRAGRLVLVHRLAPGVYDRLLPAEVAPVPASFVRVGLALVTDQDPDVEAVVDSLVEGLGADDWEARSAAETELARIGRPAVPALERAERASPDPHVRDRCRAIRLGIEGRAGGDVLSPELQSLYDGWKRTGRVDAYGVPRGLTR